MANGYKKNAIIRKSSWFVDIVKKLWYNRKVLGVTPFKEDKYAKDYSKNGAYNR